AFRVRALEPDCVARGVDAYPESKLCPPLTITLSPLPLPEGMAVLSPWMLASRGTANAVRQLRSALLRPLRHPGLLGVDLADYESALSLGGRIRFARASGGDAGTCALRLLQAFPGLPAALCVHIRLPKGATVEEIDPALEVLDATLNGGGKEILCVLAANIEQRQNVVGTALAID